MGEAGGNFSGEKFPPDPLQKTFGQGVRGYADPRFYRCGSLVQGLVRSTIGDPDLRSPSGFDSGLSPFAQDDTVGKVWQEKLEIALDLLGVQRYFKVRICAGIPALFFSFKANKKAFSCGRRGTTVVVDEESSGKTN